ncbi:MAG: hypothetical protein Ct9H300mP12_15530 [Acidimicrobiales bacterium]|nr:MAG: hypothetical protein Ct9H300mP12_15530 [Acidimicrobiales bacterium]
MTRTAGRVTTLPGPLDAAGTDRAQTRLADKVDALLAGRPLSEVRSSRAIRCLQTVGPAAARHALRPESDPSLFGGSPSAMTDLVRTRAGPGTAPTDESWCCAATPTSSQT